MSLAGDAIQRLFRADLRQESGVATARTAAPLPAAAPWWGLSVIEAVGLALVVVFYVYETAFWYNTDIKELCALGEKKSQIEKEYRRRDDLIPSLRTVARNYAEHERLLFQTVADVRRQVQALESSAAAPSTTRSLELESTLSRVVALAEQYPDLKAEESYHYLMDAEEATADRITGATDEYIEAALDYNICNQGFWCNFFTITVAALFPIPSHFEYYHTGQRYVPHVLPQELLGEQGR